MRLSKLQRKIRLQRRRWRCQASIWLDFEFHQGSSTNFVKSRTTASIVSPGSNRTFKFACASPGITLFAIPADRIVGAIVSRSMAFQSGLVFESTLCACSPRSDVSSDRIHFPTSSSSSGASPSKYLLTIAVKCTGAV